MTSAEVTGLVQVNRGADASVRVLAGGNHVTTLLHTDRARGALDVIRVRADIGSARPPHRHSFGEWFYVEDGLVRITGVESERVTTLCTLRAGDSVWVPPNVWHAAVNAGLRPARFLIVGVPGIMTSFFERAGIIVADEFSPPDQSPPEPAELASLAADHGIAVRPS